MVTKPKKNTSASSQSSAELAEAIAIESLEAIQKEIRGIATKKIKPKGHDPASRIAWLASKASAISAEQRKSEALNRRTLDALTPAQVLAWFRRLEREERQQLLAEVEQIDQEGSALG